MNYKKIIKKFLSPKDIAVFIFGMAAAMFLFFKAYPPVDLKPYENKIENLEEQILQQIGQIDRLKQEEKELNFFLKTVTDEYTEFRDKVLTTHAYYVAADSLQKEEIRKGIDRYGESGINAPQPFLAGAYGNEAFDELDIKDKMLINSQKVETIMNDVVLKKDTIINVQQVIIKEVKKSATKEKIKWFLGGTGFGGLLTLLLVILL